MKDHDDELLIHCFCFQDSTRQLRYFQSFVGILSDLVHCLLFFLLYMVLVRVLMSFVGIRSLPVSPAPHMDHSKQGLWSTLILILISSTAYGKWPGVTAFEPPWPQGEFLFIIGFEPETSWYF